MPILGKIKHFISPELIKNTPFRENKALYFSKSNIFYTFAEK